MTDYAAFLARKAPLVAPDGLSTIPPLHPALFPHQRDAVAFLLGLGRGAAFLDTGLGKTLVELEWARVVAVHTGKPVLVLAPLAVAQQTKREGARFGIQVTHAREAADIGPGINVINYERLDRLDTSIFGGVVLDESSILKSFMGKTKQALCEAFAATPFKLCGTATPAPNDYLELGNHAAFLGIMPANEMIARWFINDTMAFGSYRLKAHAIRPFWQWVASWAICVSKPSDLGYDDAGFALPPLVVQRHVIEADRSTDTNGELFRIPEMSATSMHREKRLTKATRAARVAEIVAEQSAGDQCLIWCETNAEADILCEMIPEAVEVRGSDEADDKERKLLDFAEGRSDILVTKASIAGHGLNLQGCNQMIFASLSFSYEQYYQAVRRCWRFGQKRPVTAHVVLADTEAAIWDTVQRKAADHDRMKAAMYEAANRELAASHKIKMAYVATAKGRLPAWLT